ncbi:MAG: DUF1801 domain-containing protein [Chloroflexi bacterium]|jgi:hypothetical protein|nr:DUF1801 domain-containing protein [Chloroflexota bacterium]
MTSEKTVDGYIGGLGGERGAIVAALRDVIRTTAPEARETIKWAQPVYESGGPFAYIKAFGKSVNLGFWRGSEIRDPSGRLIGEGDRMRHVRLVALADVDRDLVADWVRQAVELNRTKGDPTKGT